MKKHNLCKISYLQVTTLKYPVVAILQRLSPQAWDQFLSRSFCTYFKNTLSGKQGGLTTPLKICDPSLKLRHYRSV